MKDFPQDLPALLNHGVQVRTKAINNPESPKIENIFTQNLEQDDNDFIISFLLNMMEACSQNEAVPGIICRVLLNNMFG